MVGTVGRLDWTNICALAADLGKHDGSGKPPTPQRATKTWTAVRRPKAATAALSQAGPKSAPSHDLQPEQTRPLPQPSTDFWDDPGERTKIPAPNIKEPTAVAPIPERLVPTTKEAAPIPHSKQTAPPSDQPSENAAENPKGKLARQQMEEVMAELSRRSNERNGVF